MIKKILFGVVIVGVIAAVVFFLAKDGSAKKDDQLKTVKVTKGSIIEKALAVGKIVPKREISVKSKIGGLVRKIYVEVGDRVTVGDPLLDIAPDPTPIEYAEAKRQVELSQVSFENTKTQYDRDKSLRDKQLISNQQYEDRKMAYDEAELRLKLSKEKLALIESGHTEVANRQIDNVIKSTISGTVLSIDVKEGDPVVPLTSYQAGSELMALAYMEDLLFEGNVDEIDVGKLNEGMNADIEIGALPNQKIAGALKTISPKAHKEEGSTLFEVEITIPTKGMEGLRAGYSANANVIIARKDSVLVVPERLVKTKDSTSTVEIRDSLGVVTEHKIKTGLSDGINIEVDSGLIEGQEIVERPPREITAE